MGTGIMLALYLMQFGFQGRFGSSAKTTSPFGKPPGKIHRIRRKTLRISRGSSRTLRISKFKGLATHAADLAVSTRFDTKSGSWGIPVVTAGLTSKFRTVLSRLC